MRYTCRESIMVVVFISLDWIFVLMNTTTMIPCRCVLYSEMHVQGIMVVYSWSWTGYLLWWIKLPWIPAGVSHRGDWPLPRSLHNISDLWANQPDKNSTRPELPEKLLFSRWRGLKTWNGNFILCSNTYLTQYIGKGLVLSPSWNSRYV